MIQPDQRLGWLRGCGFCAVSVPSPPATPSSAVVKKQAGKRGSQRAAVPLDNNTKTYQKSPTILFDTMRGNLIFSAYSGTGRLSSPSHITLAPAKSGVDAVGLPGCQPAPSRLTRLCPAWRAPLPLPFEITAEKHDHEMLPKLLPMVTITPTRKPATRMVMALRMATR